ncbi:MAG: hypothetical protein QF681_15285 [Vicinamibacterales bacterium]|jgi:hypothetical protein|nr:hypothetical protein [Vicinamibacterales bacterium]
MRRGTLVVFCTLITMALASGTPAFGQWVPKTAEADVSEAPRTPWGDPDFQGLWNNSTTTPLERLTSEEQAQSRRAQRAVIEATGGTGAGWLEQGGRLGRESLIVDPPDGRMRMTEQGVQRLIDRENARAGRGEGDSWLDRNTWERCISRTLPTAMIPTLYNANYQIFQTPDHFVIVMEMIHEARIVALDGRPHASDDIRQWLGDARGHWEGDTLVVETMHFNDRLDGGDYQPSHVTPTGPRGSGETLKVVERFTLSGGNTIDYQITVEDPQTFAQPYTAAIPMHRSASDVTLFEYACHEGNHAMVNLLHAGRADEQLALDAAALVSRQRKEAGHPGVREPAVPFAPVP